MPDKSRLFIGSSVEGLSIAYAIQDNIQHNAEVTVWPQGVFDLSKAAIESLVKAVNSFDFGIFVFSPDDVIKMRGRAKLAARDNVIFELGLFIGNLGRDRVFIIIPDNNEKLHIPSDLLGVMPGKYETARSDNNLHSATATFCNQVRTTINSLGKLRESISSIPHFDSKEDSKAPSTENPNLDWSELYSDKKYEEAIDLINGLLLDEQDDYNKRKMSIALLRCELNLDFKNGVLLLESYKSSESEEKYGYVASAYLYEGFFEYAIKTIEEGFSKFPNSSLLTLIKAEQLELKGSSEEAIACLTSVEDPSEDLTLRLCDLLITKKQKERALQEAHKAFLRKPNSERITAKFASIAHDLSNFKLSLYLYDFLARKNPKKSTYITWLAGTAIHLGLYDTAIASYRRAIELSEGKEEWIFANLGNVLKIVGAFEDSKVYFKKSLEITPEDSYVHNRLSEVLRAQEKEKEDYNKYTSSGRVIAFSENLAIQTLDESNDDDNDLPF